MKTNYCKMTELELNRIQYLIGQIAVAVFKVMRTKEVTGDSLEDAIKNIPDVVDKTEREFASQIRNLIELTPTKLKDSYLIEHLAERVKNQVSPIILMSAMRALNDGASPDVYLDEAYAKLEQELRKQQIAYGKLLQKEEPKF